MWAEMRPKDHHQGRRMSHAETQSRGEKPHEAGQEFSGTFSAALVRTLALRTCVKFFL
jgi:hypothetical protein